MTSKQSGTPLRAIHTMTKRRCRLLTDDGLRRFEDAG
jgi:hypothetical protein